MGENCRLRPVPRVAYALQACIPWSARRPCGLLRHSMMKMAVDESASIGSVSPARRGGAIWHGAVWVQAC